MTRGRGIAANLTTLCASVAFERAAYFGLQSLLALYLADLLLDDRAIGTVWLLPELASASGASGVALAAVVTGLFGSFATFAPLIGGIIADRLIGPHRAILLGGVMMALGHGLLMVEAVIIPALTVIALGSGFFKGSVAARLSGLYASADPRRVEGFRSFYLAINIAGLIAPLAIGTVGERWHWHAGFALSCAAMVAGLALYANRFGANPGEMAFVQSEDDPAISAHEQAAPIALVALGIGTALLTVPNAQLTNAYLLWAKEGFVLDLGGWSMPVSWLIAADGLLSLVALTASGVFWAWHDRRRGAAAAETKALAGACFVVAAGACLALAALVHGRTGVPIVWGLVFQLLNSFGLANGLPAVMASFGQASPRRLQATVMAGFYLSLFAGGLISTWLASKFVIFPITTFWLLHALCGVAGALTIATLKWHAVRQL
jgi:proton-dependent oligopeptide transporter, POT family